MSGAPVHGGRAALFPVSLLWGAAAGLKNFLYDRGFARPHRLAVPVVSIGNITAGGTGKTPLTIELGRRLLERGLLPVVLSRGYRSQGAGTRVVSDGRDVLLDAGAAGDEPFLIASRVPGLPVVVDPDRVRGGEQAVARFDPDLVMLDDGFQHRRLDRDLDVVLLDAEDPFGRYRLLPAGTLREPFSALARADMFVVTHAPSGEAIETLTRVLRRYNRTAPLLRARHVFDKIAPLGPAEPVTGLKDGTAYAFCGIGNPGSFRASLLEAGIQLAGFEAFPDHHRYVSEEIGRVGAAARAAGASWIVTTEKDAVRLPSFKGEVPFYAFAIRMEIEQETTLVDRIVSLTRAAVRG